MGSGRERIVEKEVERFFFDGVVTALPLGIEGQARYLQTFVSSDDLFPAFASDSAAKYATRSKKMWN